jgi:hypothetical protein
LREALIGTWRLISWQDVDGATPLGDSPRGYLVYTPDGHVFVQMAARKRPKLFGPSTSPRRGPVLLETTPANTALGFVSYCGTFEVRDGEVLHHMEFAISPSNDGRVEHRSVVLNGDRLILGRDLRVGRVEWERIH